MFSDVHRAFLQQFLAKGVRDEAEVEDLLRMCTVTWGGGNAVPALDSFVVKLNQGLGRAGLMLRKGRFEGDGWVAAGQTGGGSGRFPCVL